MKFFKNQRVPISFHKAVLGRNNSEQRTCKARFKIKLNGNNIRSTPTFVQEAFRACKSSVDDAKVRGEIEVQNVDFYHLPEAKRANIRFETLTFDHLHVTRDKDSTIYLVMETSLDIDKVSGEWVLDKYGTDFWCEFIEAQPKLIDDDAVSDDAQGSLDDDGEGVDDEEAEGASA